MRRFLPWVPAALVAAAGTAPAWRALAAPGPAMVALRALPVDGVHSAFIFSAVARRLVGRAPPFRLTEIWHPVGRDLFLSVFNVLDAVLAAPLVGFLGPARGLAAWSALALLSNGAAGAWLGALAARSAGLPAGRAAAVGAAVLAFCPYGWVELGFGRPTQAWLAPLALALGLAWRAGKGRLRDAVAAGVAVGVVAWQYWFYGLFAAVAVAGAVLGRSPDRRGAARLAVAGAVALALVLPFAGRVALAWEQVPGANEPLPVPSPGVDWLGGALVPGHRSPTAYHVPLPFLALALAALAARSTRRAALGLLAAAVLLGLFASGGSHPLPPALSPYRWFQHLPGMHRFWWPERALGALTALVALLAALGAARPPALVAASAIALSAADALRVPGLPGAVGIPRDAGRWSERLPPGAVVWLPLTRPEGAIQALLLQPLHGRPLVNGMSMWEERLWPPEWRAWFESEPLLRALVAAERGRPVALPPGAAEHLRSQGVAGLVVERRWIEVPRVPWSRERVLALLGPPECPADDVFCTWTLPDAE